MTEALVQKSMTLEDARKILWMRPNIRPVGELLDEGYLDQDRLQWAAAKAYNANLRQAAQVILDWQKQTQAVIVKQPVSNQKPTASSQPALPLTITLEQARATLWPIPPYKGQPMGLLVETRQLSLKDLGYAIENAWENRVRQAAIALMSVRLQQALEEPASSTGFVHIISSGRSFAERRQLFFNLVQGGVMGGALVASIAMLLSSIADTQRARANPLPPEIISNPLVIIMAIALAVLMLGVGLLFIGLVKRAVERMDRQIAHHRKGQEGEERVVQTIQQTLDSQWYLFRNVVLPGENKADLDSVLVGPTGVWVLEIKNLSGEYRNIADQWEYSKRGRWKASRFNPSRQAQNHAVRLANFLKADGIQQWVTPALVWANSEAPLSVENPGIAVWTLDRLRDELGNLWQTTEIPEDKRQRIVEKLTKLCDVRRKAQ
ncbi:MAG: nuclease-related domain-containing protein [Chloroflexota bacterium]